MPVLLLARGDQASRTLLRQAIEARYGHSAPMIETLKIDFKGKMRVKVAFTSTWMPIDAAVCIKFPSAIRWDVTMRPAGLPVNTLSEAFDGESRRRSRVLREATVDTGTESLKSSQARLWSVAVMLLTPLSDPAIQVSRVDDETLEVENTESGIHVNLTLNEDKTLNQITTPCYNPDTEREQVYRLRVSGGQCMIDDLMLPRKIEVLWDDELDMEISPLNVEINPTFAEDFFKI